MGLLLLDFLPQFLNRVVVRRIGGQLHNLQPWSLSGEERFRLGAGMIPRSILNQDNRMGRLLQHAREKGNVGCRIETAFLPLIKEASRKVINQPEDLIAFALARGLDLGLLAAPCSGVRQGAPLWKRRFITKQQQSLSLFRPTQHLRPRGGTPLLPLLFIKMIRNKGRFLIAEA
jgi:hypothetical protein